MEKQQKPNLWIRQTAGYVYLLFSFLISDAWLRVMTRWIGRYSIFAFAPNCFTFCWSLVITIIISLIRPRTAARIVYGILFFLSSLYSLVQYFAWQILGRFLYLSDFLYASEGGDYQSYILGFMNWKAISYVLLMIVIGIVGIYLIPDRQTENRKTGNRIRIAGLCIALIGILAAPFTYEKSVFYDGVEYVNNFAVPSFEYSKFVNSSFDLELTGTYQFVARDIYLGVSKKFKSYDKEYAEIDQYFFEKDKHEPNEMTGIFKGKNMIVVLMESMDDWLIDEKTTPTIQYMMDHGINFTNLYTPKYSSGYTFNTEFAFNISVYPYSNGNAAYALARNTFSNSIAAVFGKNGYNCNSFHEGKADFYNRGLMHQAFGYEQYHSYYDYDEIEGVVRGDDTYLTQSEALMDDLTNGQFMSFIITFTPHLPYNEDDESNQYIAENYPQYLDADHSEVSYLKAKASVTDAMFAQLLEYLEEKGLKDNTVIAAYADHYAYGLSDHDYLQKVSEDAGSSILEKTPAFIYCSGLEEPVIVEKIVQITDLAPTIENLFGFDVPEEIMGKDAFDSNYPGIAVFSGEKWLTDNAYVSGGTVIWNNCLSGEEIDQWNEYVLRTSEINDYILDSNYYALER